MIDWKHAVTNPKFYIFHAENRSVETVFTHANVGLYDTLENYSLTNCQRMPFHGGPGV